MGVGDIDSCLQILHNCETCTRFHFSLCYVESNCNPKHLNLLHFLIQFVALNSGTSVTPQIQNFYFAAYVHSLCVETAAAASSNATAAATYIRALKQESAATRPGAEAYGQAERIWSFWWSSKRNSVFHERAPVQSVSRQRANDFIKGGLLLDLRKLIFTCAELARVCS